MHQWSRRAGRTARAGAATLTAVWIVTIGTISTGGLIDMNKPSGPGDASALAPAAAVGRLNSGSSGLPSYQADASASVLRLGALVTSEGQPALTGLRLGTATAAVDTASHPESGSSATQVTGAVGAPAPTPRTMVVQGAGERGRQDGSISRSGPGAELRQLTLGTSRLTASAHWGPTAARAAGPVGISSALARPGELLVHPDREDAPLLQVWRGSQGRSQTQLVAVPGQTTLGVRATARAELTAVTLFRGAPSELTIRFLTAPSLVAVATGTDRTGVRYAPPTIAVTAAQGRTYRLNAAGETVDIPLAGPGGCGECASEGGDTSISGVVRISLGGARQRVGHTSVDATAAAVRLQVLGVPGIGRLLDTTLGDLDVSARVPLGGLAYQPPPVAGSPIALAVPTADVASPQGGDSPHRGDTPQSGDTPASDTPAGDSPQPVAALLTPRPTADPGPDEAAADGPMLPLTGASVSVLIALGLGLLGIGWVVLRATRRPSRH